MPMMRSPEDLLKTELQAIYSAEQQLSQTLPRLSQQVQSDSLREMFDMRCEQAEELLDDIEDSLEEMNADTGRERNVAAQGLLEDTNLHLNEIEDEELVDPFLLAAMQKIEHYCIAAWGTARSMAELMGEDEVVDTMERALDEGKRFDKEMTNLAEQQINPMMLDGQGRQQMEMQRGRGRGRGRGRESEMRSW